MANSPFTNPPSILPLVWGVLLYFKVTIKLLLKSENGSYLNVGHSHQGQQFFALIIMLLGNFYQTFSEFLNILLFPWSELNYILDILVHF